jgi:hypothetical protein
VKTLLYFVCSMTLATMQGQDAMKPAGPAVIGTTYELPDYFGKATTHLYEKNGRLCWDIKTTFSKKFESLDTGKMKSESIEYNKVNFVEFIPPAYREDWSHLAIGEFGGRNLGFDFPS